MALIRNNQAVMLTKDAIVLDLGDLKKQGEKLIKYAYNNAENIISQAQKEAQILIDNASAKGYASGYEKGNAQGNTQGFEQGEKQAFQDMTEKLKNVENAWNEALTIFRQQREQLMMEARRDVLSLALEIANRVVHRIIEIDPTVVKSQILDALQLISKKSAVIIAINPDDQVIAQQALTNLINSINNCNDINIIEDPDISRGGCKLQSGSCSIDSTIETQLNRIVHALLPSEDINDNNTSDIIVNINKDDNLSEDADSP